MICLCNPSDGVPGVSVDWNVLIWQQALDSFDRHQSVSFVAPALPPSWLFCVKGRLKQRSRIFKTRGNVFKKVRSLFLNQKSGFWFPWLAALFLQSYSGSRAFQKEGFWRSRGSSHVIVAGIRSCGNDIFVPLTNHCFATDVCPDKAKVTSAASEKRCATT